VHLCCLSVDSAVPRDGCWQGEPGYVPTLGAPPPGRMRMTVVRWESGGRWKKDDARALGGVSALSFLVGWWHCKKTCANYLQFCSWISGRSKTRVIWLTQVQLENGHSNRDSTSISTTSYQLPVTISNRRNTLTESPQHAQTSVWYRLYYLYCTLQCIQLNIYRCFPVLGKVIALST